MIPYASTQVPALLDPKFAIKATADDQEIDHVDRFEYDPNKVLTQGELQYLRANLKDVINFFAKQKHEARLLAHQFHEMSDKSDPSTETFFTLHSVARDAHANADRHLRKLELIQRKIRIALGNK